MKIILQNSPFQNWSLIKFVSGQRKTKNSRWLRMHDYGLILILKMRATAQAVVQIADTALEAASKRPSPPSR